MTRFIRCAFVFFCLLGLALSAFSQSRNTGEIRGTVTAGGAVVPEVAVTLTNIDTGEAKHFVTNGNGLFDTVSTPAGNYTISFSAPGFKKLVRGPITVEVSVLTEDANLDVGAVTETLNVDAGAQLLDTETGHVGAILEAKTIEELPQIGAGITGNDWANFNILLPGAAGAPSQPVSEGSGAYNAGDAIAINGNLPNYANYLQDGGVVQLPTSNNVDNTLFEAVQEVQITTSSFSAEYGIGGAVFNQITKGGGNQFHGSAYEYFQGTALNARPHFGIQQKDGSFAEQNPVHLRYNEWGGSIGGPIIKNKLFFYFVRDKLTNNAAAPSTSAQTPTLAETGQGTAHPGAYDFTGLPTLYDPLSCNTPNCVRTSFAAENTGTLTGVNAIPANRIDPVALKMLSLYPSPNVGGSNNFSATLPGQNPNLRWFGRIDYEALKNNRVSFSISQKDNPGFNKGGPFNCPINCFSGDIDGYNVQATDTWEVNSTMVNEFRMAYTKQGNWFVPSSLGYNPTTTLGLQYSKANVLPQINITSNSNTVCCSQITPGTNAVYIENLYDPSDVLTLIRGKHVLHFGAEFLMSQSNTTPWGNIQSGQFTFSGRYTAQTGQYPSTGAGLADFLLGDVQSWNATNAPIEYNRLKSPQAFVQDDYKLRPNLTVNLGLRYVGTTGFSELNNAIGGFDPKLTLNCPTTCGAYNGTPGSLWFGGQNGRTTLQQPIYDTFLPRVGFAWSFWHDTVLRGGFGMYTYNYSQDTYGIGTGFGAQSSGNVSDPNNGSGPNPLISLSSSAATANATLGYVPAGHDVSSYVNLTSPKGGVPYMPFNTSPGRINEWQVSLEHQFAGNYKVALSYVGSHGSNLSFPMDPNQILNPTLQAADYAANKVIPANRTFPVWAGINGNTFNAISNYNGMQATIAKHFSSGLFFNVNYVWSHFLDDADSSGWGSRGGTENWQVANNPAANYGNSNFDIPQAVKGYASYDLPFGKGKAYLSNNNIVNSIVGGWRISGTGITQSGNPFTVTNNTNYNSTITGCGNGCVWRPNIVGSTSVSNPGPAGWFNTAAFANASLINKPGGVFAFGNEGRNALRGPRLTVFNMSLAKNFNFGERVHLQLRSDWVNVFNHASLNTPGLSFGGSNFGLINNSTQGNGVAVAPRSGQLSARITF